MSENKILKLTHNDIVKAAIRVAEMINIDFKDSQYNLLYIFGVPRGGISCAYLTINFLDAKVQFTESVEQADIIIDDIVDSGTTRNTLLAINPNAIFYSFFKAEDYPNTWLSFSWERTLDDEDSGIEAELLRLSQFTGLEITEIKTRLGF